jgi:hypothetical protein
MKNQMIFFPGFPCSQSRQRPLAPQKWGLAAQAKKFLDFKQQNVALKNNLG